MDQVTVFVVPAAFVLLQLFSGAELLPNSEHAGEDALWWDLQIGGEEGPPVEGICRAALKAEDVVDRGNHQIKVLLPINETPGRLFALTTVTRVNEIGEGLESSIGIWRSVYIKHSDQGLSLIRIGEIRIVEHDEDLEDYTEIGADGIFSAGDGDGSG